jgi:2-polyprenyl-3-methyl-5-hydroxy-6-metoxy-1,4-benzoquinol methylase
MKFKCLNCNSKKFKLFYHIKKFPTFFGAITKSQIKKINNFPLEVSYCIKCNLVQQTKPISEKYMNEVYNSKYYNCPSPLKSGMGLREIHKFWNFFNSIKQKKGKVLEIASFDGYLMSLLEKKNWDVHGCDPSAESILARKKFKNKIKTEFFRKGIYPKGEFDLIIFRNLLEHIYDINKFLKDVNFSLKKDGHIFIDVPNIKSIIKAGSFGVFFHQHLSYFSTNTIVNILEKNNFKVLKIHEGNPNLFIYAQKKITNKKTITYKSDKKFLEKKMNVSQNMKSKILKIFLKKNNQKIVLFGISALATSIVNIVPNNLKKKIVLLVDNDKQKHGKYLSGSNFIIKNPSIIKKIKFDKVLICSYFFIKEIIDSLKKTGISKEKIIYLK